MIKDKVYIFDTTLRDGAQTQGVDFNVQDKNKIAIDNLGQKTLQDTMKLINNFINHENK